MTTPQNWGTPRLLFDRWNREMRFTIDSCAERWNAKLPRFFDEVADGLRQSWAGERVWCNPPFNDGESWVEKAIRSRDRTDTFSACLVLASTGSGWFHDIALEGAVYLFRGRIRFDAPPGLPPRICKKTGRVLKRNSDMRDHVLVVFDPELEARGIVGTRCSKTGEILRDLRGEVLRDLRLGAAA